MKQLTEQQFDEQFEPVTNHIDDNASFDGCMFETYGEELEYVKQMAEQNRVVTIIEGDNEETNDSGEPVACMYYVTGYHLVNRIGFLILDKPYTEEFEVKLEW